MVAEGFCATSANVARFVFFELLFLTPLVSSGYGARILSLSGTWAPALVWFGPQGVPMPSCPLWFMRLGDMQYPDILRLWKQASASRQAQCAAMHFAQRLQRAQRCSAQRARVALQCKSRCFSQRGSACNALQRRATCVRAEAVPPEFPRASRSWQYMARQLNKTQ